MVSVMPPSLCTSIPFSLNLLPYAYLHKDNVATNAKTALSFLNLIQPSEEMHHPIHTRSNHILQEVRAELHGIKTTQLDSHPGTVGKAGARTHTHTISIFLLWKTKILKGSTHHGFPEFGFLWNQTFWTCLWGFLHSLGSPTEEVFSTTGWLHFLRLNQH